MLGLFRTLAMSLYIWLILTSLFHKTNGALGYDAKTAIFCGGSVMMDIISDGDESCDAINNQGGPENIAFCQMPTTAFLSKNLDLRNFVAKISTLGIQCWINSTGIGEDKL